ncbi:recombinase family protein [Bifidobacterium cuniculi]|uniref:Resolvase, N-terminal domain protein n=1 Tax=Bifidobacterium cuniculi TaxID=1688 RepID=A0A087ATG4_9BIFI|nr:recombinase family protein [Bifidobacterium cuniculi]KFI62064.1 resolvase, N-terminal domain protein [Bifidobacterium cuniculi]
MARTYLRRAEAADRLHISVSTFKLLVAAGRIRYELTPGGQKVYAPQEIDRFIAEEQGKQPPAGELVFYVRDSEGNTARMRTQEERLKAAYGAPMRVYRDRASGLNERRKGLARLLDDAEHGMFDRVAVTARDRFSRFGASYLERHLRFVGVELVVLDGERDKGMSTELMDDFMALLASFSGRFYKLRSIEHQKLLLDRASERLDGKDTSPARGAGDGRA